MPGPFVFQFNYPLRIQNSNSNSGIRVPIRVNTFPRCRVSGTMHRTIEESGEEDRLAELALGAARGDGVAFAKLAARVRGRVLRWAGRLVRDDDAAEDVAQLVLLRLREHVHRYEGRSRFTSWLYQITRNVALSAANRERRRRALLAIHDPEARALLGGQDSQLETTDPAGLEALVRACFVELTDRQREVFELVDLRGLPSPDVARRLGIAPATVRVLLMKARRTIRLRLLEQHAELLEEYER
ncbi:MAG: RNA polymerase sigma factor [Gemmatimonadota bacterium]